MGACDFRRHLCNSIYYFSFWTSLIEISTKWFQRTLWWCSPLSWSQLWSYPNYDVVEMKALDLHTGPKNKFFSWWQRIYIVFKGYLKFSRRTNKIKKILKWSAETRNHRELTTFIRLFFVLFHGRHSNCTYLSWCHISILKEYKGCHKELMHISSPLFSIILTNNWPTSLKISNIIYWFGSNVRVPQLGRHFRNILAVTI